MPHWFRAASLREFSGERLLWEGMPDPGTMFWRTTPILLFGIPWAAFSFAWEAAALTAWWQGSAGNARGFGLMALVFPIFGLPFVLIGIGFLGAPFWAWMKARRTVYALTDKRLAILTQGRALSVKSLNTRAITTISRAEKDDRSGTLTISMSPYLDSDGDRTKHQETLYGIPDVHAVELLLREAMAPKAR